MLCEQAAQPTSTLHKRSAEEEAEQAGDLAPLVGARPRCVPLPRRPRADVRRIGSGPRRLSGDSLAHGTPLPKADSNDERRERPPLQLGRCARQPCRTGNEQPQARFEPARTIILTAGKRGAPRTRLAQRTRREETVSRNRQRAKGAKQRRATARNDCSVRSDATFRLTRRSQRSGARRVLRRMEPQHQPG